MIQTLCYPQNQTTHLSKLLSYILRHKPGEYEIVLYENGCTNVDELIGKFNAHNENISFEISTIAKLTVVTNHISYLCLN